MATSTEELPEFMQVVADYMTDALIKNGIAENIAANLGVECCMAVMKAVGGDSYYIPKGVKLTYTKRDLQIYNEFFGTSSIRQLSAKYGITTRRIYQIVAAVRMGEEVPEQLNLFEEKDYETGGVNGK